MRERAGLYWYMTKNIERDRQEEKEKKRERLGQGIEFQRERLARKRFWSNYKMKIFG